MSLRNKQALILLLATVLPFAMGAVAVGIVVAPAYRRTVAHASEVETSALAQGVAWNLARAVERLERLAGAREVRQRAQHPPPAPSTMSVWNRQWANLQPDDPAVRTLLENDAARELAWWQETDPTVIAMLATDAHGRVVAATRKPHLAQFSGEEWWQESFAGGNGQVIISDIVQDRVTKNWGIRVAVPIYTDPGTNRSQAIGVLAVIFDAPRAFQEVRRAALSESGRALLVDEVGRVVVSSAGEAPLRSQLAQPGLDRLTRQPVGTFVAKQDDDTDLIAWSAVPLGTRVGLGAARTPVFYVITRRSAGEAFGPLRTVNRWMLAIGLFTIFAAVGLGYWLADVWVVRQVRQLAAGMRELSHGNFEQAATIAAQLTHIHNGKADAEEPTAIPH